MGDHYEPTDIVGNNTISNDTTVVETENKQNSSETVGEVEKEEPVNVNSTNESSALDEVNKTNINVAWINGTDNAVETNKNNTERGVNASQNIEIDANKIKVPKFNESFLHDYFNKK